MMPVNEVKVAAEALASHMRAGLSMNETIDVMPAIQPDYADYWESVGRSIAVGEQLSQSLPEVWPAALVAAVRAGEESGKLEGTFNHIVKTTEIQLSIHALLKKLRYPLAIAVAGVLVFIAIMVFVAPLTAKSFKARDANAITKMAFAMEAIFKGYWHVIAAGVITGGYLAYHWVRSEEGKSTLINLALTVPHLGAGLSDLYFGLWLEYMSMVTGAGITTDRAILLTAPVMPEPLRDGALAFERDISVNSLSLEDAADSRRLSPDDGRQQWPLFVTRAFIVGGRAGDLSGALLRSAPELVRSGVRKISTAIEIGNLLAVVIATLMVSASFVAIYAPILGAVKRMH